MARKRSIAPVKHDTNTNSIVAVAGGYDAYKHGNPAAGVMGPIRAVSHYPALTDGYYSMDTQLWSLYEEMLHKDAKIAALIDQRIDGVTNCVQGLRPAGSDAPSQRAFEFVEAALKDFDLDGLIESLLTALPYGVSVCEIAWRNDGSRIIPGRFWHHHPSKFQFDRDGVIYRANGDALDQDRFVVARYGRQFDNPYGDGLLAHVMYHYWFKKQAATFWIRAAERLGIPTLVGKYEGGNEETLRQMEQILIQLRDSGYAGIPKEWELSILEQATQAGAFGEGLHGLCSWLDGQIAVAIVGVTLTSAEGDRTGSLALGSVHDQVRKEKIEGDAKWISMVVNEFIERLVRWNLPAGTPAPHYEIETDPPVDPKEQMDIFEKAIKIGVPVPLDHIYDTIGVPVPGDNDRKLRYDDSNLYQYHLQYGVLTVNEVRASLGLPPLPGGDLPTGARSAFPPASGGALPGPNEPTQPGGTRTAPEDSLIEEADAPDEFDEDAPGLLRRFIMAFSRKKKSPAPLDAIRIETRRRLDLALAKRLKALKAETRARARQAGESDADREHFLLDFQLRASQLSLWLDPDALTDGILHAWALSRSFEYDRLNGEQSQAFAEGDSNPWRTSVERFLAKQAIDAEEMETWLAAIDRQWKAGLLPGDINALREEAYREVFTMVREADAKILSRVDRLVERAIEGQIGPNDFVQDMDDLYRYIGLDPQEGWYSDLVADNALNRSWQEGRDSLGHTWEEGRGPVAESWVWGYEWDHQDSDHPRPAHAAMDLHAAPVDDPIWQTFGPPPIAHHCHCIRYTISKAEAIERGFLRDDGTPDPDRTFDAPKVTADQLEAAGITGEKATALVGLPANEIAGQLPGNLFDRSRYNIPKRPFINPSAGGISDEAKEKLKTKLELPRLLEDGEA